MPNLPPSHESELERQAEELKQSNHLLQEQAVELEAQTQELQEIAARLEERTAEAEEALRLASTERARAESIFESMADSHFVLDEEFRFLVVNSAMERAVALSRSEMLGRTLWDVFPGTVGTAFEENYRRVATQRVEAHFVHDYSDGRLDLVVDVDAYPAAGGGVAIFWRDVTEREQTAAALRASEHQLRTLADAIPTLAWTAQSDGFIDWYNARWYEYTGTTPDQMRGWGWQSVHDPAVLPAVMEQWQASIATGEPFEMTFPLLGKDGTFRAFLTRVTPVKDPQNRVLRWFGTNTDVAGERLARDLAERAAERTRRLQSVTAALAGARTMEEVAGVVVEDAAAATGAQTSALVVRVPGTDEAMIVSASGMTDDVTAAYTRFPISAPVPTAWCLRTGEPVWIESLDGPGGLLDRFGERPEIWTSLGVEALASVPLVAGGVTVGAMTFAFGAPRAIDAEDQAFFLALGRQTAQAIERARLEQAERTARENAESANQAKSDFLAVMSHELRTPLNAIAGYAELIALGIHGPVTPEQQDALARIQRSQRNLLGLINDVLNFAKLEAGHIEFNMAGVRICDVIDSLEPLIELQLQAKALRYDRTGCAAGPDSPLAYADAEKLRQIIVNLLSNAIKFTPAGGSVWLRCKYDGNDVCIEAGDTGIGIAKERLAQVFEPFVQIDRQLSSPQEGTGLGLAISRDLARGMGGDLSVESTLGVGSTFTLRLARADAGTA